MNTALEGQYQIALMDIAQAFTTLCEVIGNKKLHPSDERLVNAAKTRAKNAMIQVSKIKGIVLEDKFKNDLDEGSINKLK